MSEPRLFLDVDDMWCDRSKPMETPESEKGDWYEHCDPAAVVAELEAAVAFKGRTLVAMRADRDALRAEVERLKSCVPTNWISSMLSGPDAALPGTGPWGCREIEALLRAIQDKMRRHD